MQTRYFPNSTHFVDKLPLMVHGRIRGGPRVAGRPKGASAASKVSPPAKIAASDAAGSEQDEALAARERDLEASGVLEGMKAGSDVDVPLELEPESPPGGQSGKQGLPCE